MESTIPTPDTELLTRYVHSQDEAAFGELVRRYEAIVLAAAMRRTGSVEIARDVAQQVFVALARKAERLLKHGRIAGWLYRAASFEAARAMQAEQRRRHRQAAAAEDPVVQEAVPDARWATLEDALDALSSSEREVIVQHYFQDHSYPEMAAALGLKEPAVRKRVSRAVSKLGKELTRRGVATPAVTVLAGAMALQAQAPAQAGIAAQTLAAISKSPDTIGATALSLSTSVMLKATTATIVLATIPLCWQWNQNRALSRDLERALSNAGPQRQNSTIRSAEENTSGSLRSRANALERQLSDLRTEREAAEKRLAALEAGAERIRNEVVVSFGNVEDVAASMARLVRLGELIESDSNDEAAQAATKELLAIMPTTTSAAKGLLRLDEDPQTAAQFVSAMIGELGRLDSELRKTIGAELLPHLEAMKEDGLVFASRPEAETSGAAAWNERYDAASRASMQAIEHLVPEAAASSDWWQSLSEGYGKMLHFMAEESGPIIMREGLDSLDENGQSSH